VGDTDSFVKAGAEIQTAMLKYHVTCGVMLSLSFTWQKWLCWASRCLVTGLTSAKDVLKPKKGFA